MFETEQKMIEEQIQAYLKEKGLPEANIQWTWIPFSGNWGIATSFFQLAAQDAKEKGQRPAGGCCLRRGCSVYGCMGIHGRTGRSLGAEDS